MGNQGTVDECKSCGNTTPGTQVVWCGRHNAAHCNGCGLRREKIVADDGTSRGGGSLNPTWEPGEAWCGYFPFGHWKVITRR